MNRQNLPILTALSVIQGLVPSARALQADVTYEFELGLRYPIGGVAQGSDVNFYRTTSSGRTDGAVMVFKLSLNVKLDTLPRSAAVPRRLSPEQC